VTGLAASEDMNMSPEPRRCVAPVETIETEEHRYVFAAERIGADLPEAGAERRAAVAAWLDAHPEIVVGADMLCGRDATTERTVEGVVMPLCAEHAAELDADVARERAS
jgi:hypothetical protein